MAQEDGFLQRNFQGYTTHGHCDVIGLGVSAISQVGSLYCQNDSDLAGYQHSLANDQLATVRGLHCNADDLNSDLCCLRSCNPARVADG